MASDPPDTDMRPRVGHYSVSPFLKQEVSDQIRNRDPKARVSWNWYDTWQEEHCRAFVVAKLCKADLLQEVHSSIQRAVDTGMTFQEWKKDILPKLEGEWIGRKYGDIWVNDLGRDIEDLPESQREKKIRPRRLETIYRTNMKVAHAAGQYQSMKDMAELYPYWRYCTVDDGRVREEHQALNNKVFRHDDPFWDTHYPPNGWNCRCYVRAMDEMDLEDAGLEVTKSSDLQQIPFEGEASGRMRTAYGIGDDVVDTDDGWNYNPGKVSAQVAAMAKKKVDKYEPPLKREVRDAFVKEVESEEARQREDTKAGKVQSEQIAQSPTSKERPTAAKTLRGIFDFIFGPGTYEQAKGFINDAVDKFNEIADRFGYALNPQSQLGFAYAGGGGGNYGASNMFMARNDIRGSEDKSRRTRYNGSKRNAQDRVKRYTEDSEFIDFTMESLKLTEQQSTNVIKHLETAKRNTSDGSINGGHNRYAFEVEAYRIVPDAPPITNVEIKPVDGYDWLHLATYEVNGEKRYKTLYSDGHLKDYINTAGEALFPL